MTRRKDGRWQEQLTVTEFGRKKVRYFYGRTKADVLRKIADYHEKAERGPLFSDVADDWWTEHQEKIAYNTRKPYKPALRRAKKFFGGVYIRDIHPFDVSRFLSSVEADIDATRKTIKTHLQIVNMICRYAVNNGQLESNPARDIETKGRPNHKREIPEDLDIKKIKESEKMPMGMFALWALYTGLRRGELLALTWQDIDLPNREIFVTKSLYYENGKAKIKTPKTEAGNRTVPIPEVLAKKITPHLQGVIFRGKTGSYFGEREFREAWDNYRDETGINCTPHQLRHAYATMLYENNVSVKDAQEILGHAQASTTLDIYTDVRKQQMQKIKAQIKDIDIA